MHRLAVLISALAAASPAIARDHIPFYGPKSGLMGEGYKHKVQKDGVSRIVTEYHTSDPMIAMNVALYRAAELARQQGKRYVQVVNGYAMSSHSVASGFVFAIGSDSAAAPTSCKAKRCYTADVAKVLEILSGPDGRTPGVPKPSFIDDKGHQVTISGFGIGAVAWAQR